MSGSNDKQYPRHKRCTCSTKATIKTVYDRTGVIYHCGNLCLQYWIKTARVSIINSTETNTEGFLAGEK